MCLVQDWTLRINASRVMRMDGIVMMMMLNAINSALLSIHYGRTRHDLMLTLTMIRLSTFDAIYVAPVATKTFGPGLIRGSPEIDDI